jgi:hypothetical protein
MQKYPGILMNMAIDIEIAIRYFLEGFRMQDRRETYGPYIGFYAVKSKHRLSGWEKSRNPFIRQ